MKLIVGLGNFPKEYQNTRHNTGFIVVDKIQEDNNFSSWQENKKFKGEISTGELFNENCILCMFFVFLLIVEKKKTQNV